MTSRTKIGLAIAGLLISIVLPTPHAGAFSNGQSAAISIGQWESPSYGILSPDGGLVFDPLGNLWVAATFNNRVLGFRPPFSGNMSASYVLGQLNFQGTKYGTGPDRMGRPIGITTDSKGDVWVVDPDNSRILAFEPPFHNGMNASIVIGQHDFKSTTPSLSRSGLYPEWATFDAAGDLWVSDGGNSRVLEFQPPFSTGMNASLVIGQPDFTHDYCPIASEGCESWTVLHGPGDIAFDPAGNLWAIEYAENPERLIEFKPPFSNGMRASNVFSGGLPAFNVLAFDSAANLWMGSSQGVFEFKPPFSNPYTQPVNASASLGGYPGESWSQNLLTPSGLTFDSSGNLWVTDCVTCWLMTGWDGRVLGFNAGVHSVDTTSGTVSFANRGGLLLPLSHIQLTQTDSITFPAGLFNFTIQGLPADDSVTVTVSFPHALPAGMGWWSRQGNGWKRLPANQTQVEGNNMTLIFTHASLDGAISEVGGPAEAPANLTETNSINTLSPQNKQATIPILPASTLASVAGAIAVVSIVVFYWKHKRKTST